MKGRSTPIFFPLLRKSDSFGFKLKIEIADTPEERIQGLSGRKNLAQNAGLLFVHSEPGIYGIWMKDMRFAIDVIWLDFDYRVIDIARDIQPDSYPQVFQPSVPALYILEVNAGFTERNNIKIGDDLNLLFDSL